LIGAHADKNVHVIRHTIYLEHFMIALLKHRSDVLVQAFLEKRSIGTPGAAGLHQKLFLHVNTRSRNGRHHP